MLTVRELEVINVFRKDPLRKETIRGIMKAIGRSTYNWTFQTATKCINNSIFSIERHGKAKVCSINLNSSEAITYLALLDSLEAISASHIPQRQVDELVRSIPLKYFTFIVTGSYAEKKQKNNSDLDICVITEEGVNLKRALNSLESKGDIMIPKAHPYVFSQSEFIAMLLDKDENYGKLVNRKRLIFFGAENYYLMLREAIRNGFRS